MAKEWKSKKSLRRYCIDIAIILVVIWLIYTFFRPRQYSVSGKPRDTARQEDLSEIATAINNYKDKYWVLPELDNAINWMTVSSLPRDVMWWQSIPLDPNPNSEIYWLWDAVWTWDYLYLLTQDWWFILMAKTEWDWWSNWVVCKDGSWLDDWYITNDTDINEIKLCKKVKQWETCSSMDCTYTIDDELRYIHLSAK